MKKNKILFGLAALVIAFGLTFTTSAFTKKDPTYLAYQYTGDDDSGVMTPGNWTPITYNPTPTECESIGELPCVVQFEEAQFADINAFLGNFPDADAVNSSLYTKRHKDSSSR